MVRQAARDCPHGHVVAEAAPGVEIHAVRRKDETGHRDVFLSVRGAQIDGREGARARFEAARAATTCGAQYDPDGRVEPNDPHQGAQAGGRCGQGAARR